MENWFKEVGRPALFDALAGACDRIDNVLDVELGSRIAENTRLSTELERLKSQVSDVDRLREENQSLQREIKSLKDANGVEAPSTFQTNRHDGSRDFRLPLAPKSVNQVSNPRRSIELGKNRLDGLKFSELKEEHVKLGGSYTKLREKYSELEDAHTKLNQRLRDMTKAYNRWMDHANKLNELCQKRNRTIKKLEAKLDAATAETSVPFDASFSSDGSGPPKYGRSTIAPQLIESNITNRHTLIQPGSISRESPLIWPPTTESDPGHGSLRSTVSASPKLAKIVNGVRFDQGKDDTLHSDNLSTQDEEETTLPPLPHDRGAAEEDVLIKHEPSSDIPVVVSERYLRKRKHADDQIGEARGVARVKVEEGSSGPHIINERRQFVPYESVDFDAEGGRVDTPRKRDRNNREFEDLPELGTSIIPVGSTTPDGSNNIIQNASAQRRHILPRVEGLKTTRVGSSTTQHQPGVQNVPPFMSKLLERSITPRERLELNEPSSLCNGISSLAEDGNQYETPRTTTKKAPKIGRLRDLLDNPTSRHEIITPTKGAVSDKANISSILESEIPQRRELPFGKNDLVPLERRVKKAIGSPITTEITNGRRASTNAIMKQSTNRRSERRSTEGVTSDVTPLRERSKSQLGINDFKINPKVNEGYDFAFTDIVRNKNERANLAGCVQEGCCGQTFRLQARVQRGQASAMDFQALLEKYLGDDAWRLSTMTKPEKEELWLDAKTQELSNEHGRHRHRFHRAATPAGFWRTDFPNTQEEQGDKEEAARMSRQIVDERYREAMRPGGKWLFRDE